MNTCSFSEVLTTSACHYALQLIRRAISGLFRVLEAAVAALMSTTCVMVTMTAVITVMKIQNSANPAVSHSVSYKM